MNMWTMWANTPGYTASREAIGSMSPNQQTAAFLRALYEPFECGYIELRLISNQGHIRKLWRPLPLGTIDESGLERLRALNAEGWNIYYRVGISAERLSTKDAIVAMPGVFVDVDLGSDDEAIRQAAYERIAEYWPTCIISSGGGWHAYWLFDKPHQINSIADRERFERLAAGLSAELGGDAVVRDVSRLLRVPGFDNVKPKYATPPPCLISSMIDPARFEFDALERQFAIAPKPAIRRHIPFEAMDRSLPLRVQQYISYGAPRGQRATTLLSVASMLRNAGYAEHEASNMLMSRALADDLLEAEINKQIASAYKYAVQPTLPSHMAAIIAHEDS